MKNITLASIVAGAALATAFTLPAEPVRGTLTGSVLLAETGKVLFDGEKPEVKPLAIDAAKSEGCGSVDTQDQSLLFGANGGIANVVVTVELAGATVKPLEKPMVLDQITIKSFVVPSPKPINSCRKCFKEIIEATTCLSIIIYTHYLLTMSWHWHLHGRQPFYSLTMLHYYHQELISQDPSDSKRQHL